MGRFRVGLGASLLVLLVQFSVLSLAAADDLSALDLSAYRGKVVVVDFWASWCVPCRRSFPWLETMQRKYGGDGLVVIGINEDSDTGEADAFLQDFPVSFRIVSDSDGRLARRFELIAMPSSYVIGRDGELAVRHLGFKMAKQDDYEEALRRLLYATVSVDDGVE